VVLVIRSVLTADLDGRAIWFVECRLGQGRDKVVQFLREYPAVCSEIEKVGAIFLCSFSLIKQKWVLESLVENMEIKLCEIVQAVRERIAEIMTAKRDYGDANGSASVAYAGIDGEDMLSEESLGELD
jgi:hypothetical protein